MTNHNILLGGIGGDSHSVGLAILRQALQTDGYRVHFLGTQNHLEDFTQQSPFYNVVMMSSLDGHARYYLRNFPEIVNQYEAQRPLWYLGGNLHIGDGIGCEKEFLEMGIDRVFVKFADATTVLEILRKDLYGIEPMADFPALSGQAQPLSVYMPGAVADALLEQDVLERSRREVLEHWKTGHKAGDLYENAAFLAEQPSFVKLQALVNAGKRPMIIQPRSGVPLLGEQIKLFKAFKNIGIKALSYQVDSLTRNNNYTGAEEAIRESMMTGVATINGFPVINHGVPGLRQVIRQVKVPLQTRHSTRDPRLLAEISYAGGVTSFEGGAICYNIPYYKDYPLDDSIRAWQYVDRLTGIYNERFGIVLDREFFGTLTGTLVPPSLAISIVIVEAMLAVRQGVKSVSLGYAEQGHRIQDIAAIRAMRQMATEILCNLGYKDVRISTVFHQYMAAFPSSRERAAGLIYDSAVSAALSGATRIIVKTPAEASRIPSVEDNIEGIAIVHRGIADAAGYVLNESRIVDECALIRREVEAILASLILCGNGDMAQGIVSGFQKGYLDIPFSPSKYNRGEVMTARDVEGAVRFLAVGNLQFDRELRQFHEEKMQDRRRAEGLFSARRNYLLIERDVLQIPRGLYKDWPLYS